MNHNRNAIPQPHQGEHCSVGGHVIRGGYKIRDGHAICDEHFEEALRHKAGDSSPQKKQNHHFDVV